LEIKFNVLKFLNRFSNILIYLEMVLNTPKVALRVNDSWELFPAILFIFFFWRIQGWLPLALALFEPSNRIHVHGMPWIGWLGWLGWLDMHGYV